MGAVDVERQALNVWRMRLLGAEVVPVESGSATLKDAVNDAMREWVASVETHALLPRLGDGPAPVPVDGARVPARRRRRGARGSAASMLDGADPDLVVACVGGGSNAIGHLRRVPRHRRRGSSAWKPAGSGSRSGHHGAAVSRGVPGVVHGMRSLFLQDEDGQVLEATSISAGPRLSRASVPSTRCSRRRAGPRYDVATDDEALAGFQLLVRDRGHRARARARARDRLARARSRPVGAGGLDGARHAVGPRRQGRGAGRGDARGARCERSRAHLRERRDAGRKLLVPYVTGGLGTSGATSCARSSTRAPTRSRSASRSPIRSWTASTIQEASQRALDLGATPIGVIDAARRRSTSTSRSS